MKLSIWNIYCRLAYPDMIPLIKDGTPTIDSIRWIVSRDLNPDTVYIGNEEEFFAAPGGSTIIVHRNDMILIHNADPEEVFNDVSSIVEMYRKWDLHLESCYTKDNGLTEMLAESRFFLQNPSFIYAADGKALAIAPGFSPDIHWHWAEILRQHGLTEEQMANMQEQIDLSNVFLDRKPTVHNSHIGCHSYIHCSLLANGYIAGHLVIFGMLQPFERGLNVLVSNLVRHMNQYISLHAEKYSPTSRIGTFIKALIHQKPYSEKEFRLFQKLLGWDSKKDYYQFYILKETVKGEPVLLTHMQTKLTDSLPGSVAFLENNFLIFLLNLKQPFTEQTKINTLLETLPKSFYCGISNVFRGIDQASCFYRQALTELVRCKERDAMYSFASDNIGSHLQDLIKSDSLNISYANRYLLSLREYDRQNHSSYYETLRAWFYSGFHPTTAAFMLHIHRNSFNYRMERIRELISFQEIDAVVLSRDISKINEYLFSFMCLDQEIQTQQAEESE